MEAVLPLADRWLQLDRDEETRGEINELVAKQDAEELEKRLRKRIAFGTAGLRSSMKAGFAHMNSLNVLTTSIGLAHYIRETLPTSGTRSVVIGYDGRYRSRKFARLAATAFLDNGLKVLWFDRLVHTPLVPFAVSHYGAAAGVMVTASHNPKNDNGYKVYWANGSQIVPPHDVGIAGAIDAVQDIPNWDESLVDTHSQVGKIYDDASKAYFEQIRAIAQPVSDSEYALQQTSKQMRPHILIFDRRDLPFTYTPMHGVGLPFMQQAVKILNIPDHVMHVVAEQAQPDPEFSTVSFPNPEEKGALKLASRDAASSGTTVIIANDPDADRFSAAEQVASSGKGFEQFTGNQLGILLASHVFETYTGDIKRLAMLSSTVSSRMLAHMASIEGFHFVETLTGFKWLGNVAQDLRKEGWDPAFAFEEAIGYMFPSVVWDKDGIAAAAVFLTAWRRWHAQGLTPRSKLQQLYGRYGYFADANTYVISPSPAVTDAVFAAIRKPHPGGTGRPERVGARSIRRWRDLTLGFDSAAAPPDHRPNLPVDPSAQMITCELEGDVVFTVRGSGTEPKIKFYIEATAASADEAQARADEVLRDLLHEWFRVDHYGLKLAAGIV